MNPILFESPAVFTIRAPFPEVKRQATTTLQLNLGYLCNQKCHHCHVAAGPMRTEIMSGETIDAIFGFLNKSQIRQIDLTGGAPEMNPHFRSLVERARSLGVRVTDRCNLTVLGLPEQRTLPEFLARHQVEITASLPCYQKDNVDGQRGEGVFEASIQALQTLNLLGYGREGSGLILNLVYNPSGPVLPPPQKELEEQYREELRKNNGIVFNQLFVVTNMPIRRFRDQLTRMGQLKPYLELLRNSFLEDNMEKLMCRNLISVDWEGFCYDCDFNQMLDLPLGAGRGRRIHISELEALRENGAPVRTADHCFGCTAGQGSSCGGALSTMRGEADA